jgi:diguanylate cyclase (GGDEF)-like protein
MKVSHPVILLVDDSRLARASVEQVLRENGYNDILHAASASEALNILGLHENEGSPPKDSVDLILMDFVMPDLNGIEACRRIKKHHRIREIPVIMVTAKSDPKTLARAFEAGVMDYLTKPIQPIELIARVNSALTLKSEIDRRRAREQDLLDMTGKLASLNRELQKQNSQDGLTKVANRRLFDQTLDQEWRRAKRDASSLALIMLDIDYFKKYNDRYGHAQGDECLKKVARTLDQLMQRPGDLFARYGGEEFSVILPGVNQGGALTMAEKMRNRVESLNIEHADSLVAPFVTISLGAAHIVPVDGIEAQALLEAADKGLYLAKKKGRNRVGLLSSFQPKD